MGGRTLRTQVPLYLDDDKVEALARASKVTGRTQQDVVREGLDMILAKIEWTRERAKDGPPRNVHTARRKTAPAISSTKRK
jgi:hypothetical protein